MNTLYWIGGIWFAITILVWMFAVGDLMLRRDQDFPGKSDKLVWGLILAFGQLFGGIVYFACRFILFLRESNAANSNMSSADGV